MTLFSELYKSAKVYHPDKEDSGKVVYPDTPDFEVDLVIISLSTEDKIILGDIYGDFVCNTAENRIEKGDKIVCGNKTYFVTNTPTYTQLFKRYQIYLRAEKE